VPLVAKGNSKRVVYAALVGNALIAATKFAAAAMTGSSAMLSEAVHSLVDTGNQVLLLLGMRRAAQPPTGRHPFGFGRELYFYGFVVAVLIFGLGAGWSLYEGVAHLTAPRKTVDPVVNYMVLGLSLAFESASFAVGIREFRRAKGERRWLEALRQSKDPAMFVALVEDSAAIIGLFIAFAGIAASELLGDPRYDAAASVMIGLVLAVVAIFLAIECKSLLIGESAGREVIERIRRVAARDPRVGRVAEVLTTHFGPDNVLLNLGIEFAPDLSARDVLDAIDDIEAAIRREVPIVRRIYVEATRPSGAAERSAEERRAQRGGR
jgi:cation diffusion facilitator family transporter